MADGVVGLLLAGGQSRRMGGGDKSLAVLGGETLLARCIERLAPQVGPMVINTNGDPHRFAEYGLPVAADVVGGFAGPLAGVLTGLEWARDHAPGCAWVASAACDAPFFPTDLVARFRAATAGGGADMARAASGGRAHPVFGLWPVRLAGDLRCALIKEDIRKVDVWTARYRMAEVAFQTVETDPFFNLNRPEDLEAAEAILRGA